MDRLRERASVMRASAHTTHDSNLFMGEVAEDETGLMNAAQHSDDDNDGDDGDDDDYGDDE